MGKCEELMVQNKNNLRIRDLATILGKLVALDPDNKWARNWSEVMVRALNWNIKNSKGNFEAPSLRE